MSDNLMSRRKFLVSAGTVAGGRRPRRRGPGQGPGCRRGRRHGLAVAVSRPVRRTSPTPRRSRAARSRSTSGGRGCAEATWWPFVEFLAEPTNAGHVGHAAQQHLPLRRRRRRRLGHHLRHAQRRRRHHRHVVATASAPTAHAHRRIFQYYAETAAADQRRLEVLQGRARALDAAWRPGDAAAGERADLGRRLPAVPLLLVQWTMTTGNNGGRCRRTAAPRPASTLPSS